MGDNTSNWIMLIAALNAISSDEFAQGMTTSFVNATGASFSDWGDQKVSGHYSTRDVIFWPNNAVGGSFTPYSLSNDGSKAYFSFVVQLTTTAVGSYPKGFRRHTIEPVVMNTRARIDFPVTVGDYKAPKMTNQNIDFAFTSGNTDSVKDQLKLKVGGAVQD